MNPTHKTVLAIESAILGGSLSLQRDGVELANWVGISSVSRAEELLPNIDQLLTSNGISRGELNLIAVSSGPGSFTGIRIGLATALGLKVGLGIEMASETALRAMAFARPENQQMIVAVPVGRDAVCVQSFARSGDNVVELDGPLAVRESDFLKSLHVESKRSLVLHDSLFDKTTEPSGAINFGANIAFAIGQICLLNPDKIAEPLFISKGF